LSFSPAAGVDTPSAPFSGTLSGFMSQVTGQQSQSANAAQNLQQGQDVVVNALQQRFNSDSGVNIDTELSNLITLLINHGGPIGYATGSRSGADECLAHANSSTEPNHAGGRSARRAAHHRLRFCG
jgi:hypothetical protein